MDAHDFCYWLADYINTLESEVNTLPPEWKEIKEKLHEINDGELSCTDNDESFIYGEDQEEQLELPLEYEPQTIFRMN